MPSNSSFPPLVAKHINISRHSSMLVKGCWGASSEQSPGGSSHITAFGVLHPSNPSAATAQP